MFCSGSFATGSNQQQVQPARSCSVRWHFRHHLVAISKLLQHARVLANGQSDAWAMLDGAGGDVLGLGETVARVKQALDRHAVGASIAHLVEVAVVRIERVARFLARPIVQVLERKSGSQNPIRQPWGSICPAVRALADRQPGNAR
jgi:hypothetical protein